MSILDFREFVEGSVPAIVLLIPFVLLVAWVVFDLFASGRNGGDS